MLLIGPEVDESAPFVIDKQVTLYARGLQVSDKVVIEVVSMTKSGPRGDFCCPGQVVLPEIDGAVPLLVRDCCADKAVELTALRPWVVLDAPQQVPLRARVVAAQDASVEVELFENTTSSGVVTGL